MDMFPSSGEEVEEPTLLSLKERVFPTHWYEDGNRYSFLRVVFSSFSLEHRTIDDVWKPSNSYKMYLHENAWH
jgi:hypothetical protein